MKTEMLKVGDKVIVINDCDKFIGQEGKLIRTDFVNNDGLPYCVEFNNDGFIISLWYATNEIEKSKFI